MNYKQIYESIINRALGRKKLHRDTVGYIYYEKHHIIPRCLGGLDIKDNLVLLTAEEHWVSHLLLVKIHPGNNKLIFACQAMSMAGGHNKRTTNKLFGWIRREYSHLISQRQTGRKLTVETRAKISKSLKGRPTPHQLGANNVSKRPEVAKKISNAAKGRVLGPRSNETKNKISVANKGHAGLIKELNGSFKGFIIATPKNGGPSIRIGGKKEIVSFGFTYDSVLRCVRGDLKSHKGYLFRRE